MAHDEHDDPQHQHPHHSHAHAPHHHPHSHEQHRAEAPSVVACWVVTCSDTRTTTSDEGGPTATRLLTAAGHTVAGTELIRDEATAISQALTHAIEHGARCIIFTGGTGIGRRDVTVETLEAKFDKQLHGFGELFRALSVEQIGTAAWLSRATAGVVQGTLVFALPGSPRAVELALTKLILPELGHAVREMVR